MEKRRAATSVAFFAYERGFSTIFLTAAVAVLVLVGVLGWQTTRTVLATNAPLAAGAGTSIPATIAAPLQEASTSASVDPISTIGSAVVTELANVYFQLQDNGSYSSSTVEQVGQRLAPYVAASASYPTFEQKDIRTDNDTSYARMLRYRSDLRASLAPLLQNTEPEYQLFARYVDTKDATYLSELQTAAVNYRIAASSTALVVVPEDAVQYHLDILNSLEEFAATLDAMVAHASDPFASVALLRGYNQAESDVLNSFNAIATYAKSKRQ